MHQFNPWSTDAGNLRQRATRRQTESAILFGLGLLTVLATVAIGLRIMEPSALTALPPEPPTRVHASVDASNAMRSRALAAARPEDSNPFDESEPESRLLPEPLPVTGQMPAVSLTPAGASAVARPSGQPESPAQLANISPACTDALRAMQLCPDIK